MARNQIATKDFDGQVLVISFKTEPETVKRFDFRELPEPMKAKLALHGLTQKIGDSYAGAANVAEAIGAAVDTWENLMSGVWGREREAGEGNLLEQACQRLMPGKTKAQIAATLEKFTKEQLREFRKRPDIVRAIGEIQAERAAARVASPGPLDAMFE